MVTAADGVTPIMVGIPDSRPGRKDYRHRLALGLPTAIQLHIMRGSLKEAMVVSGLISVDLMKCDRCLLGRQCCQMYSNGSLIRYVLVGCD